MQSPDSIPRGWKTTQKAYALAWRLLNAGVIPKTYATQQPAGQGKRLDALKRSSEILAQIERRGMIDIERLCADIERAYLRPRYRGVGLEHDARHEHAISFIRGQGVREVHRVTLADQDAVRLLVFLAETKLADKRRRQQSAIAARRQETLDRQMSGQIERDKTGGQLSFDFGEQGLAWKPKPGGQNQRGRRRSPK